MDEARSRTATPVLNASRSTPGTDGLWTFVFIDMIVFFMIFLTFMAERLGHMDVYRAAQQRLNPVFGLANTLILLTSSLMVVKAVHAARLSHGLRDVRRHLALAWLFGLVFCVNKLIEYHSKLHAGITPATNSFFSYYFFITVIHFLHVIAGMVFIAFSRNAASQGLGTEGYVTRLENVGLFWHFVDVLWIFIFPLLYLVGRR